MNLFEENHVEPDDMLCFRVQRQAMVAQSPDVGMRQPSTASGGIPSCLSMILCTVSWLPSVVASS